MATVPGGGEGMSQLEGEKGMPRFPNPPDEDEDAPTSPSSSIQALKLGDGTDMGSCCCCC